MRIRPIACSILLFCSGALEAQRLPPAAAPSHYDLKFTPDFTTARFLGDETIDLSLLQPSSSITLNASEIQFQEVTITSDGQTQTAAVSTDPGQQTATLTAPHPLAAGTAKVHILFTGILNDKLRGFYLSHAEGRSYAFTQFEPTEARRAFPCFDEPSFKATFDVTVVADTGDTAISNGRVVSDTPGPGPAKHTIKFSTSPRMSSYLVAMAVGKFGCVEGAADGIPIRVCGVPERTGQGRYALEAAEHILPFYDNYFGIKYPFGKLDIVAVPDFEAGAMENLAAIFSRDFILIDDKTTSESARRGVAGVLAHEMAHMWFGDLVTMDWWNDLWLNEGFATWMSRKPLEAWQPGWNVAESAAAGTGFALDADALATTHAIRPKEVETRAQINEMFDGITYGKTAAVLRMIEAYEGADAFREGVEDYLRKHEYSNAGAQDFWSAQAEASMLPIDKIMPTFVLQPGEPVVGVDATCDGGQESVTLSQRRFFLDPALFAKGSGELWQIPVCLKYPGSEDAMNVCQLLTQRQQTITLPTCQPWVYANAGARGYFRTSYSPALLGPLNAAAEADLTPSERIMLLADEWAMVRIGSESIADYLGLAQSLALDPNRPVAQILLGRLQYVGDNLLDDSDRESYRAWVRTLLRPAAASLTWTPEPGETGERGLLRASVLDTLGGTGRDPEILAQARSFAGQYLKSPESIDANLADTVLGLAGLSGDAQLYAQVLDKTRTAKSPGEYRRYLFTLAGFSDPALLQRTLELALSPQVRSQDAPGLIDDVMFNPAGRELAWNFVKERWDALSQKLSLDGRVRLIEATGAFCDAAHRDDVQRFFAGHPVVAGARPLAQTLERIDSCISLRENQASKLAAWLAAHPPATTGVF